MRLATQAEPEFRVTNSGGVAIRVTTARAQDLVVLYNAGITLSPLRPSPDGPSGAVELSDASGIWSSGALPPGPYAIEVRLIGYRSLRDTLTIRHAFRDTVDVQLRRDILC